MALANVLKVNIINWVKDDIMIDNKNFGKIIYINKKDFQLESNNDFKGLSLKNFVKLENSFVIRCVGYGMNSLDDIDELFCEYSINIETNNTIEWSSK